MKGAEQVLNVRVVWEVCGWARLQLGELPLERLVVPVLALAVLSVALLLG